VLDNTPESGCIDEQRHGTGPGQPWTAFVSNSSVLQRQWLDTVWSATSRPGSGSPPGSPCSHVPLDPSVDRHPGEATICTSKMFKSLVRRPVDFGRSNEPRRPIPTRPAQNGESRMRDPCSHWLAVTTRCIRSDTRAGGLADRTQLKAGMGRENCPRKPLPKAPLRLPKFPAK